jgi:4-carboxymuconolactone decarboxylase
MTGDRKSQRFPRVPLGEMNAEQRRVADTILASSRMEGGTLNPGHIIPGPFNAWMQAPELATLLERVGDYVRFRTTLPTRLSELAILITARHWTSQFEWFMHERLAIKAGLNAAIAADIAASRRPADMADDEAAIYDFCMELRRDKQVSDATFAIAVEKFGHRGVIELIAISGYYDLVSMTLNVAQVGIPKAVTAPLSR